MLGNIFETEILKSDQVIKGISAFSVKAETTMVRNDMGVPVDIWGE